MYAADVRSSFEVLSHYLGQLSKILLDSWYAISLISIFLFFILIISKSFKNRTDGQTIISLGMFPLIFALFLSFFIHLILILREDSIRLFKQLY